MNIYIAAALVTAAELVAGLDFRDWRFWVVNVAAFGAYELGEHSR